MNFVANQLVSVIVPVYNSERYIKRTASSILSQSYNNIELILIDDGSDDHSFEVLKTLASQDGRVRIFHTENRGVSRARNFGIQRAEGTWITFVDADDYLEEDFISNLISEGEKHGAKLVISGLTFDYYSTAGQIVRSECKSSERDFFIASNEDLLDIYEGLFRCNYIQSSCAKLFSADLLRSRSITFDPSLNSYEDYCFVLDCLSHMQPIYISALAHYHYRHEVGESNSRKYKPNMLSQMQDVAGRTKAFYQKVLYTDSLDYCNSHIVQFLIAAINNIAMDENQASQCKEISDAFSLPIFRTAAKAKSYPNRYSNVQCWLGVHRFYILVLAFAKLRNIIRGRYLA